MPGEIRHKTRVAIHKSFLFLVIYKADYREILPRKIPLTREIIRFRGAKG